MKRALSFIALLFSIGATTPIGAQSVYNYMLENATRVVNMPSANFTQTRIAQFKLTALVYIKQQAFKTNAHPTAEFLNTQAYFLSEFLSLFFNDILKNSKATPEERKAKIYQFMDASLSNPLFNDPDEETTMAYIKEGSQLTPFSLDTDWQKAYAAARNASPQ